MKLTKYRRIDPMTFSSDLQHHLGLEFSYFGKIRDFIENERFVIVKWHKPTIGSPLFRLTVIVYILVYMIILISMPIKWLFTGKIYYEYNSKIIVFMVKWVRKLGF